ncbi:hypothetical protein GGI35DRAFT_24652 [Trichoderma velutinum]
MPALALFLCPGLTPCCLSFDEQNTEYIIAKARQLTGCLHIPLSRPGDDVVLLLAPLYMIGLTHAKNMHATMHAACLREKKKRFGITRNSIAQHHPVSSHIPVRTVQPFQTPFQS